MKFLLMNFTKDFLHMVSLPKSCHPYSPLHHSLIIAEEYSIILNQTGVNT